MLVLTRRTDEEIIITVADYTIIVKVCEIDGNKCKLGFVAPAAVRITRRELLTAKPNERKEPQ